MLCLWLPGAAPGTAEARWLAGLFPDRLWIAVELLTTGRDRRRLGTLQALGDVTWLLLDDPAHGGLWTRRAGEWLAVNIGPGRPLAMQADAAGERLLLATAAPTRLVVLGRDGGLLHEWPLRDAGVPAGVCWLPAAA